jgi:CBS domain-containing protein
LAVRGNVSTVLTQENVTMSEFEDEYSESLDTEFRKLQGALLEDTVRLLAPSEPLRLTAEHSVARAIQAMVQNRRAAIVIVDDAGRLIGIFTERDVLTRVMGAGRVARDTLLRDVMTPEPESLRPDDRICFAINRMHAGGFRSLPLVDDEHRPIGIITVNDVVRWLAEIFPEAVLNMRPGDRLKNPAQIDAG